jgi:Ca2+/Na+ antiporter
MRILNFSSMMMMQRFKSGENERFSVRTVFMEIITLVVFLIARRPRVRRTGAMVVFVLVLFVLVGVWFGGRFMGRVVRGVGMGGVGDTF